MAGTVSNEELQLKKRARRRLVGAIVLVTAVAVLLPMVLDSEPKPASQSINIQIPSPDAGVLSAKPEPLKSPQAAAPAAQAETAKPPADSQVQSPPAPKPETKPETKAEVQVPAETPKPAKTEETAVKESPKKEAPKAKEPAKEKPKAAGGYVIQVAALSDAARAKELQAKIAGGGLKAYTEVVQTAKGPVTRVRVGPYASREAAEKARPQLQKLQLDGKVVPR
jgi:DedD protein